MCMAFVRLCKCRVCSSDVSSLVIRKGLKKGLPGCLSWLLLVAIENDDGLPSYVCSNCLVTLRTAWSIESKVRSSVRWLRKACESYRCKEARTLLG